MPAMSDIFGFCQSLVGAYIGELERGQVNVSIDSLQKIADALERKIGEFFPLPETPLFKLTPQDLQQIKHSIRLLNKVFAKV